MNSTSLFPEKPKPVRYAVFFLWITFVQMAIAILGSMPQFYADENIHDEAPLLAVLLLILAFLIVNLSRGRNWARIAVILFAIAGILIDIIHIAGILRAGPFWAIIDLMGDI